MRQELRMLVPRAWAVVLAFALFGWSGARAEPPPGLADEAIGAWFRSLTVPGHGESCCGVSDCRRVPYRMGPGIYQVFIGRLAPDGTGFRGGNNGWWNVPPDRVLHGRNPTGEGVACWSASQGVLCFVPASGS